MFPQLLLCLLITYVGSSHYRGGSISWDIRESDYVNDNVTVLVRVSQRHSWRRSAAPSFWRTPECDTSTIANGTALIGEDFLICGSDDCYTSVPNLYQSIPIQLLCNDFSVDYDYASGEKSTMLQLPINKRLTYTYSSCCWIGLLPFDQTPSWTLTLVIDTHRRLDGKFNSAPVSTMNPVTKVQVGGTYVINIPMADIDGDQLQCRWGINESESGGIYQAKGDLQSNPCQLTYNATKIGYEGIAVVIEDFDSNNQVLSSIPLQFLIEIVPSLPPTTTTTTFPNQVTGTSEPGPLILPECPLIPEYIGDWGSDACIGVASNNMIEIRIVVQVPCKNSSTSIHDILTISPTGMTKGPITQDTQDNNKYIMHLQWTPQTNQYGIHPLCVTPVDNSSRSGRTVCFNILVDVHSPQFVINSMSPTGIVSQNQSAWTIATDVDIIPTTNPDISAVFFKRDSSGNGSDTEVIRVSMSTAYYQSRQISFDTGNTLWEQGGEYYILLDAGVATINQSCGIQSLPIMDTQFWTFAIAEAPTTAEVTSTITTTTESPTSTTTPEETSTSTIPENSTTTTTPGDTTITTTVEDTTTTITSEDATTTVTSEDTTTTTTPEDTTTTTTTEDSTTTTTPEDTTTTTTTEDSTTTTTPEDTTTTTTPEDTTITTTTEDSTTTTTPEDTTTTTTTTLENTTTTTTPEDTTSTTTLEKTTSTTATPKETTITTINPTTTTAPSNLTCSEWLMFGTIKNITTDDNRRNYSFCFYVNTTLGDVTISANTWTPCATWKTSGAADPLMDLYNITNDPVLLAQNDDGNSISELNCYAAVISYRLYRGNYRVVIRHPKCNYGRFELRLSAETTNSFK